MEKFSASRAARLISCHGSANLEQAIPGWQEPDQSTKASERGTALHALFEQANTLKTADLLRFTEALTYVAYLRKGRRFKVLTECAIDVDWTQQPTKSTADLVLYTQDELHIIDLKAGKIPVDSYDNAQLKFYSVSFAHFAPKAEGVTGHIVQPWANNTNSTFYSAQELADFKQDVLSAEQDILDGDLTLTPSDECLFCPANPHSRGAKGSPFCPAMMNVLYPLQINEQEILDV